MNEATEQRPKRGPAARRVALAAVALLVLAALATALLRGVALVTVADGLGLEVPRPLASEVVRTEVMLGGVEVDRYGPVAASPTDRVPGTTDEASSPAEARPVILLLPGAAPGGRDDQRVIAIATAIARADREVLVPELAVYGEQLLPSDIDRISEVALAATDRQRGVVLAGLSFGGSLGLLAAADPRLDDHVRLVATFGAYADLAGVVQAITTGVSLIDGERITWSPDPRAADVVRTQVLDLLDPADRALVSDAVEGELDAAELDPELRSVHDLLTDPDPTRTMAHVAAATEGVQARVGEVSPVRAAPGLTVPVIAMHAIDDPVIPVGEQRRLAAAYPQTRAIELTTFGHVGLSDEPVAWWVTARDLWRTATFLDAVLDAR